MNNAEWAIEATINSYGIKRELKPVMAAACRVYLEKALREMGPWHDPMPSQDIIRLLRKDRYDFGGMYIPDPEGQPNEKATKC